MTLLEQIRYFNTLTNRYNDLSYDGGSEIELNSLCKEIEKTFRSFPKEVQDLLINMDAGILELLWGIH